EGDVGGWVTLGCGGGDVMAERAECGRARQGSRVLAGSQRGCVYAGHESGGNGFDVAFDAGDLAGEENIGTRAQLQGGGQERGSVDIRIAMNLTEPQELGLLEARDEAEHASLLAEFHMVLKSDQVEALRA